MTDLKDPEKLSDTIALTDEDIIELSPEDAYEHRDDEIQDEDGIIDLTDIVIDMPEEKDEDQQIDSSENLIDSLGIPLESETEDSDLMDIEYLEANDQPDSPSISSERLDAALERVIREMVSDKLDTILVNMVEKAVTKEITKIKRILIQEGYEDTFF